MWIRKIAGAVTPAARDRPRVRPSLPTGRPSSVQALQRMIGNHAVTSVLTGRSETPAPTTVQRSDMRGFLVRTRLQYHASVLNDLPDAELTAKVAAMTLPEVKEMLGVVPLTSMHRIRGALLSRMYDDCVQNKRWKDAIWYLNGFDDPGIIDRVNRLKTALADRRDLIVAALDNPRVLNLIRTATGLAIDDKKPFGELKTTGFAPRQDGKYTDADAGTITLEFIPNPDLVNADEIAFVQTIRRVDTGTDSTAKYSYGMGPRATDKGTTVDRFGPKKVGWFGHDDAGKPSTTVKNGFAKSDGSKSPATMTDTPGKVKGTENTFEACAIAKSGTDTGRVYGCVVWGFTVDDKFGVKAMDPEVRLKTSSEFQTAVANWNAQVGGTIRGGPSGQDRLPDAK